jgi:hypothetical protein
MTPLRLSHWPKYPLGVWGAKRPQQPEPLRTLRAKGETKGSRRKALNPTTVPTREAPDDLA